MADGNHAHGHPATSPSEGDGALEELQRVAYRMWRSLDTKERVVHLQTFKYTFPGKDAIAWLQEAGEAGSVQEAVELCNKLLAAGFLKGCLKQDTFSGDSELYRFVSGMAYSNDFLGYADPNYKSRSLTNKLQQTYKEIAKFSKAATQPFKAATLSLEDFAHQLVPGRTSLRAYSVDDSLGASKNSRAHEAQHCSESARAEELEALLLVSSTLDSLHSNLKEQLGLIRLDLQQHTALQEHIAGLLLQLDTRQQQLQLLAVAAAAAGFTLLLVALLQLGSVPLVLATAAAVIAAAGVAAWGASRATAAQGRSSPSSRHRHTPSFLASLQQQGSLTLTRPKSLETLSAGELQSMSAPAAAGHHHHKGEDEDEGGVLSDGDFADASDDEDAAGAVPTLSDFESAPDSPLLLRVNPDAPGQTFPRLAHPHAPVALNSAPHPFESDIFKGVIAVYVRHLRSTPGHMFRGKKRLSWVVIQGRFKRPVSMSSLVVGHEFTRGFRNLPAPWFIENMLLPLARKISPSLRVGSLEEPHLYAPLITASQIVNVSPPGLEPGIMDAKEDMRTFDPALARAGQPLSVAARRKHFQAPKAQQREFDTDMVWTFHLWQEYLDYAAYVLALPYSTYDLTQHLDGQPLQVMVKDTASSSYMVSLLAWHSGLVRALTPSRGHVARRHTPDNSSMAAPGSPPLHLHHHQQQQQQQQRLATRLSTIHSTSDGGGSSAAQGLSGSGGSGGYSSAAAAAAAAAASAQAASSSTGRGGSVDFQQPRLSKEGYPLAGVSSAPMVTGPSACQLHHSMSSPVPDTNCYVPAAAGGGGGNRVAGGPSTAHHAQQQPHHSSSGGHLATLSHQAGLGSGSNHSFEVGPRSQSAIVQRSSGLTSSITTPQQQQQQHNHQQQQQVNEVPQRLGPQGPAQDRVAAGLSAVAVGASSSKGSAATSTPGGQSPRHLLATAASAAGGASSSSQAGGAGQPELRPTSTV